MNKAVITAAVTTVVSQFPCTIKRITGYYAGVADAYLQFHAKDEVSTTNVPVLSLIILAGERFEYIPNIEMAACIIVVSSTEATYTANATGVTFDCEYDQPPVVQGTAVGDLSTGVDYLEVLAAAGRAKQIIMVNGAGAIRYAQLHKVTYVTLVGGEAPWMVMPVASGGTCIYNFGDDGEGFTALTAHFSTTQATLTDAGLTQHYIKAIVV